MDASAVAAFLSGVGAVLSSIVSLRLIQKQSKRECEERIAEMMKALREGVEIGEHHT